MALSLVLTSCINNNTKKGKNDRKKYSVNVRKENIVEKTIDGEIDEIKVSTSIDAEIFKADSEKIVISAPSDIMQFVQVENIAGKVRIYIKSNFGKNISTKYVKAKFYVKDFSRLVTESSGNIEIVDEFIQDKVDVNVFSSGNITATNLEAKDLKISVNSSGNFNGKILATNLVANVYSSGNIIINGNAENATIKSTSSGNVKARELLIENANLLATSSGDITVFVTKSLGARATSSGLVTVYTNGMLDQSIVKKNSSGNVFIK